MYPDDEAVYEGNKLIVDHLLNEFGGGGGYWKLLTGLLLWIKLIEASLDQSE